MGKMASVARGKSGGSFSSSPKSAAKSATMLASVARGGAEGTSGASEARGGNKGAPKEGEQALSMDMQAVPKPNSEAPNRPTMGSKKPAIQ